MAGQSQRTFCVATEKELVYKWRPRGVYLTARGPGRIHLTICRHPKGLSDYEGERLEATR